MYRVFNCGIGMVAVVAPEHAQTISAALRAQGETVYQLGDIRECAEGTAQTVVM
jgi:phosphoribosylformylglycinamidine cyclo-ligase